MVDDLYRVAWASIGEPAGYSVDAAGTADNPLVIYFFRGDGFPHCAEAKPFLTTLTQRYPEAQVRDNEVWYASASIVVENGSK